jgi:1-phosphofructokinase
MERSMMAVAEDAASRDPELDAPPVHHEPDEVGAQPAMVAVFIPALLLSIEIHDFEGRADVHLHAGGQGYWVCRMIRALGGAALPCAPIGGEPGIALEAIVRADGFAVDLVATGTPNGTVVEDRRGSDRRVLATTPIPTLGRHEIDELYSAVIGQSVKAGVCVIAGAQLAAAIPDDTYRRLVADLRENGVFVIADLSGPQLDAVLCGGVDIIKLSHEELLEGGWSGSDSVRGVVDGIRRLQLAGADGVVVSRGERSTVCGFGDEFLEVRPPSLEVVDGRGGGDSMTAALAVGVARGCDLTTAVRLAAAAGALNVSRHGLGTGRRGTIDELATIVDVRPVGQNGRGASLEEAKRADLYELARRRDIPGRSTMNREQLIAALRTGRPAAFPASRPRRGDR